MKENLILVIAVAVSVLFIGLPFVFQAVRCRKNIKNSGAAESSEDDTPCGWPPSGVREEEIFLARFVGQRQPSFSGGKTVRIRPQHYKRIKEIVSEIGHDEVSIISYVDNVLNAHFADNSEILNHLFDDRHASGDTPR